MIRINLLPDDCRRAEGTPLPRLIAILLSVAVVFSLALGNGYVFLRKLPDVRGQVEDTKGQLAKRKKQVEQSGYDTCLAKIKELEVRKNAISDIYKSRVCWARKFNQLIDITPDYIGYQAMTLSEPDKMKNNRTEMHGGILTLACVSRTTDLSQYSSFVSILQGSTVGPQHKLVGSPGVSLLGMLNGIGAARSPEAKPVAAGRTPADAAPAGDEADRPVRFFDDFKLLQDKGWVNYNKRGYLPGMQFVLDLVLKERETDKPPVSKSRTRRASTAK